MKLRTAVLAKLAELYEDSAAGRHGGGKLDFQPGYEMLLSSAGCAEGEARELAERDLRAAQQAGLVTLVPVHRREPNTFAKVRLSPLREAEFYAWLGRKSPAAQREEWNALFRGACAWSAPERHSEAWRRFCAARAEAALQWRGMKPFNRADLAEGRQTLELLLRLLHWEGRQLIRWVSSLLAGNSKTLERRQLTMEALLAEATGGAASGYESLGILPVPPAVLVRGPLRLRVGGEWRDLGREPDYALLTASHIDQVEEIECLADRCLTVENKTPFLDLASRASELLLIHTSYPNAATVRLLQRLSAASPQMAFHHFGDSDPSGFHILADLRERTGLPIRAHCMAFRPAAKAPLLTPRERELTEALLPRMPAERDALEQMLSAGNKGAYEQESLGLPHLNAWPFYSQ